MLKQLRRALRYLRASYYHWSPERDRIYHDSLFGTQNIDPFSCSYPGNITIRRFSDLAVPFVRDRRHVIDLGCGTGEITCELARRCPETVFEGIDHSSAGIIRAQAHAQILKLKNISFRIGDVEKFVPDGPCDLILMFDSFHHINNPVKFLKRIGGGVSRFLLIEPQGDWKGSWNREMNFDWLVHDLDKIRTRIAYVTGKRSTAPKNTSEKVYKQQEEPVEHRYTISDFQGFFQGYDLKIRGTIAGLESYPPAAEEKSSDRSRFGKLAYELYAEIDELLLDKNLDLFAKHLVIYAEQHGDKIESNSFPLRRSLPVRPIPSVSWMSRIRGAYDVRYLRYEGPHKGSVAQDLLAEVRLKNESWRRLASDTDDGPDFLSYHWLDRHGAIILLDGQRTALPRTILPGEEIDVALKIRTPTQPGRYLLAIDMVRESTCWFSDAGSPTLRVPMKIR